MRIGDAREFPAKVKRPPYTRRNNYFFVLGGLCLLLLTAPVVSELRGPLWVIDLNISISGLLLVGVWSLYGSRRSLYLGIFLVAVSVLSTIASIVFGYQSARWLPLLSMLIFLGLSSAAALRQVVAPGRVDLNRIVSAVCVYLMLGVVWAVLYYLLETVVPGSFSGLDSYNEPLWFWRLLYFSFVTLSTLGYGDITPANAFSESLAYFEAIVGQFYIAVVVASLVGSYVAGQENPKAVSLSENGDL
jgi:hypothetical protein